MKSIRWKILQSYAIVILISLFLFESLLILGIRKYYYDNVKNLLVKQGELSSNFYTKYLSNSTIREISGSLINTFSRNISAQVQIIDKDGISIQDSEGATINQAVNSPDVLNGLRGNREIWTGLSNNKEPIMSVSFPLKSNYGEINGVIRFTTSLRYTNETVLRISLALIGAGLMILFIVVIVSIFLSRSITSPIRRLTFAASEISKGKFNVKNDIKEENEIGQLGKTLNFMSDELQRNEKLKSEFIASISHELKTPLTSIKGWAITLKDSDINDREEILEGLDIIEKESIRLETLLGQLLDFSRFETNKVKLNITKVPINDLLNSLYKQLSPRAHNENINFYINLQSSVSFIMGDENRLKQVFINILDNAFKFTPCGENIKLTAVCDMKEFTIFIEDSGCGMSEEDLLKVGQKFYRGNNTRSGTGLGLAICKEIIALHDGRIDISSKLGIGTKVSITLPL